MIRLGQPTLLSFGVVVALALPGAGCAPRLGEGLFACDPEGAEPCPPGYKCLLRAGTTEHRCYRKKGSYCGDGVAAPEEECDGLDLKGVACADLGYFAGHPACTDGCRLDPAPCRQLTDVALGSTHGCGLDDEGQAWCWGSNPFGQLGTGTYRVAAQPELVSTDATFVALAVTEGSSCGLDATGLAYCWGLPSFTGTGLWSGTHATFVPKPVLSEARFTTITAGSSHICGLDSVGQVWCWGGWCDWWLPAGSPTPLVPTRTLFDDQLTNIVVGTNHFCGLDAAGATFCWGASEGGALGVGPEGVTGDATYLPVAVTGAPAFDSLAAGARRTCGLTDLGALWCWGTTGPFEAWEELPTQDVPAPVQPEMRFVAVAEGDLTTCGIDFSGAAWCWRHLDEEPTRRLEGLELQAVWLGKGTQTLCGATTTGELYCEGWNGGGSAGTLARPVPRRAAGLALSRVTLGLDHACGLDEHGSASCWGTDYHWQLGAGHLVYDLTPLPVPVAGGHQWLELSGGSRHSCGLDSMGSIWCWGLSFSGSLGIASGDATDSPGLASTEEFVHVSAGDSYGCGIDVDSHVWCWGANNWGQLGAGDLVSSSTPRRVLGGPTGQPIEFNGIHAGTINTCGLGTDHRAWCWGNCGRGGCGSVEAYEFTTAPVAVDTELTFEQLAIYDQGACGRAGDGQDGQVYCWGWGEHGQLGNGYHNNVWRPVQVVGGHHFTALSSGLGNHHVCGVTDAGELWCWGGNASGQLGDGTHQDRFVPVQVALDGPADWVTVGPLSTCAMVRDDGIWCWGRNAFGQLGIDDTLTEPRRISTTSGI